MVNTQKKLLTDHGDIFYLEYVPPVLPAPLILFLHGQGECGDGFPELGAVENLEIPKLIKNGTFTQNFYVLAPQLSRKYQSSEWQAFYIEEMIKYAKDKLQIDPNRIYLTGLSLGGGGVWTGLQTETIASQIAAAAPVCGTATFKNPLLITKYKIPVWAFHAKDDGTIGFGNTATAIDTIKANGGETKLSIYKDGGHGIWNRAYDQGHTTYMMFDPDYVFKDGFTKEQNPNLYEWFLKYSKGAAPIPPTPQPKTIQRTIT